MNSLPGVSVIMIFLNEEKFIEEAVRSVFAQSYTNWELLLVDDGSTDASSVMAQRFAQQYPEKVCYLEHAGHTNRGMSASRNVGMRHARGKYIALLDGDDVWLPEKLERQMAIMEAQPDVAMVYGPTEYWYSWTGLAEDTKRDQVPTLNIPLEHALRPADVAHATLSIRNRDGTMPLQSAATN